MKSVILKKYGDINNFSIEEQPDLVPESNQISIAVKAVGVNFGDILIRQGFHRESPRPPAVHGSEVSGVVTDIGKDLIGRTAFKIGERVMAYLPHYGGFSNRVNCSPGYVIPLPEPYSFIEGAAFPVNFMTAYILAKKLANIGPRDKALIYSAGGGVGLALLQLCVLSGAKTYCVANPSKHERLGQMGATVCLPNDFSSDERIRKVLQEGGFDVIFDSIGGDSYRKSYSMLAPFGHLCIFGASSFVTSNRQNVFKALVNLLKFPFFSPLKMINSSRSVCGFGVLSVGENNRHMQTALRECSQLWQEEKVKVVVDKIFPFEELGKAQSYLEERKNFGKVVLRVQP